LSTVVPLANVMRMAAMLSLLMPAGSHDDECEPPLPWWRPPQLGPPACAAAASSSSARAARGRAGVARDKGQMGGERAFAS